MKAKGLQSKEIFSPKYFLKHLGFAHKILRYQVKTRKRKI